jgi:hypothetical protein
VGELAREYHFSDIDGRRVPLFLIVNSFVNIVKKFEKSHQRLFRLRSLYLHTGVI